MINKKHFVPVQTMSSVQNMHGRNSVVEAFLGWGGACIDEKLHLVNCNVAIKGAEVLVEKGCNSGYQHVP